LRKDKPQIPIYAADYVYELCNTGGFIDFLHKEMFIPTKSAFIKAMKKDHITTWPGLKEDSINNYLKMAPATVMDQVNKKYRASVQPAKKCRSHLTCKTKHSPPLSQERKHIGFTQW
jgi:hypothetical protein